MASHQRKSRRRPDTLRFLRAWLANPRGIGAILPSGRALAKAMTAEITPDTGPVLELGPGTGVFTRALLARGVAEQDLTLIEAGADFADGLMQAFPSSRVLRMDAADCGTLARQGDWKAGAVISGLPLLAMPSDKVFAIVKSAFEALRPEGSLYQFTYGPACPVSKQHLDELGLSATRITRVYANVPPAAVYRLSRVR